MPTLDPGVPSRLAYQSLLRGQAFADIETFSNRFVAINRARLKRYARKWVLDPLHHWSRQWEYPFVLNALQSTLGGNTGPRVLDAGAGVSFFPFLLAQKRRAQVTCCDVDPILSSIYAELEGGEIAPGSVAFSLADLRELPFDDGYFNSVYSISVLEHTSDYAQICSELHRVLTVSGQLVLTIDISLDGSRDIDVDQALELLAILDSKFRYVGNSADTSSAGHFSAELMRDDIFTSYDARDLDPALLPWNFPAWVYKLQALMRGRGIVPWPPKLTIFCATYVKR